MYTHSGVGILVHTLRCWDTRTHTQVLGYSHTLRCWDTHTHSGDEILTHTLVQVLGYSHTHSGVGILTHTQVLGYSAVYFQTFVTSLVCEQLKSSELLPELPKRLPALLSTRRWDIPKWERSQFPDAF